VVVVPPPDPELPDPPELELEPEELFLVGATVVVVVDVVDVVDVVVVDGVGASSTSASTSLLRVSAASAIAKGAGDSA